METPKTAAERMRPILQAMERSIDSARRTRIKAPEPIATVAATASIPGPTIPVLAPTYSDTLEDGTPRVKARAKRLPSPFLEPQKRNDYRSQAG